MSSQAGGAQPGPPEIRPLNAAGNDHAEELRRIGNESRTRDEDVSGLGARRHEGIAAGNQRGRARRQREIRAEVADAARRRPIEVGDLVGEGRGRRRDRQHLRQPDAEPAVAHQRPDGDAVAVEHLGIGSRRTGGIEGAEDVARGLRLKGRRRRRELGEDVGKDRPGAEARAAAADGEVEGRARSGVVTEREGVDDVAREKPERRVVHADDGGGERTDRGRTGRRHQKIRRGRADARQRRGRGIESEGLRGHLNGCRKQHRDEHGDTERTNVSHGWSSFTQRKWESVE